MATQTITQDFDREWAAVVNRDRSLDGELFYGVRTTGVYCRPSCPSRMPARQNVVFFHDRQSAEHNGFRACHRCRPDQQSATNGADAALVQHACDFVEQHLDEELQASAVATALRVNSVKLARSFRRALGLSVREYIAARRTERLKLNLGLGRSVAEATYEAGFGSSRAVYEDVQQRLGMTPAVYRDGGRGLHISYAISNSPLGPMLIAATERGVCRIAFGDSPQQLEAEMRGEFHAASLARDGNAVATFAAVLRAYLQGDRTDVELPLHVRASVFQQRVYRELKKIPRGETRSYGEIAHSIGSPTAHRAVARACASNRLAVAIPCHRVIRNDGSMGGYRWGLERKRKLLAIESAQKRKTAR